jgi:hypothetical protein
VKRQFEKGSSSSFKGQFDFEFEAVRIRDAYLEFLILAILAVWLDQEEELVQLVPEGFT